MSLVSYNSTDIIAVLKATSKNPSEKMESETIEFKAYKDENALHNDKALAEEICALANLRGGAVIIGVKDSSDVQHGKWATQLAGFDKVDTTLCIERISGRLQGVFGLKAENISFEGKNYLAIFVQKNISTLITTTSGKTCIRDGRSSRPMAPEEIAAAVKNLQSYDWSADVITEIGIEELEMVDMEIARDDFCKKRKLDSIPDVPNFLESIGVMSNGFVTKGGLLFFGKKEEIRKRLGDFEFRFSWKEGVTLKVNEVWSGNIWSSVKKAGALIKDCIVSEEFEYQSKKFEAPNIDPLAFHEAFINAVVHRDYSIDGMISVDFTGKILTISSPGSFYGGVTAENIAYHKPRHRNKMLARVLMHYSLVDRAGMGVSRMGIKSLVYGRAFPSFQEINGSIQVEMEAKFLRPGIVALTNEKEELYVSDLILLNLLYEKGFFPIKNAMDRIKKTSTDPWRSINEFVERWEPIVEFGGAKEDIFIVVKESAHELLDIDKSFKLPQASPKYVSLYMFLNKHGIATNEEISTLLEHSHSSTTSRFLKEVEWVDKTGKGVATRWRLVGS